MPLSKKISLFCFAMATAVAWAAVVTWLFGFGLVGFTICLYIGLWLAPHCLADYG